MRWPARGVGPARRWGWGRGARERMGSSTVRDRRPSMQQSSRRVVACARSPPPTGSTAATRARERWFRGACRWSGFTSSPVQRRDRLRLHSGEVRARGGVPDAGLGELDGGLRRELKRLRRSPMRARRGRYRRSFAARSSGCAVADVGSVGSTASFAARSRLRRWGRRWRGERYHRAGLPARADRCCSCSAGTARRGSERRSRADRR